MSKQTSLNGFVSRTSSRKRPNEDAEEVATAIAETPATGPSPKKAKTASAVIITAPASVPEGLAAQLGPAWSTILAPEIAKPYFNTLLNKVAQERRSKEIFPPEGQVFNAFKFCPFEDVKVVIVGQDPYHAPAQAHGLCFSVLKPVKAPPSLVNIYKELEEDQRVEFSRPKHGDLSKWAQQGVFMLNAVLTVERGKPNSHKKWGWEQFTDAAIKAINSQKSGVVFLLWGKDAQVKGKIVDRNKHHVLEAPHPSPLARGFNGCGHFGKTNELLQEQGLTAIDWALD
eukprot:GILK01000360.1.p1 GENE.GILK01000360.1~~GILK01000360.1.p1  ORF type:complete len:312 (-),score=48.80 GILK01000360.1:272-1126(-)